MADEVERFYDHPDPDRMFQMIEPAEIEMEVMESDDVRMRTQLVPGGSFAVELSVGYEYAGRDCTQNVSMGREAVKSLHQRLGRLLEADPRD